MIKQLNVLLADTYALYLKTQNYHWNVKGEGFFFIHEALEKQYQALAEAVDDVAERIRALGEKAPGSFSAFASLTTLKEGDVNLSAHDMLKDLAHDHQHVINDLKKALANAENDEATGALLSDRLVWHEKTLWMINSSLSS